MLVPVIAGPVVGAITADKEVNYYFVKILSEDSLQTFNHKTTFGKDHFAREDILDLVKDRPQVLANTSPDKYIYIKELQIVLNNYNAWYRKTKEEELKNNTDKCP